MSNINGFHPSSSSMSDNKINDTGKRRLSASDNSITSINKRLKSKNAELTPVDETRSAKGFTKKQKTIEAKKRRLIHNDSNNNNNNSTKKIKQYSHSDIEHSKEAHIHQHMINNDYCHSCGECYGEMISCDTCPATFHLFCINPSLSKEDTSKGSYCCEKCRTITKTQDELINKDKQEKIILPFSFVPKKNLHLNGFKKHQQCHSTIEQIKLPTASNGRSLLQPSGEIKFRATNNKSNNLSLSSTSNLRRKRIDSSSPPPSSSSRNSPVSNPVKSSNTQLEALHRLFLSCESEEFHGPSLLFNDSTCNLIQKNSPSRQNYCFICRKSTSKQGPSIHCDYCPLTYHLDCLTPPIIPLPLSNEKWMCPNHMEPILDRYLSKKKTFSPSGRTKIYHQYSQIDQNTIIQDFADLKQSEDYLLSKNTINNHRLERIHLSQIPKSIEEFYLKAKSDQKQISELKINNSEEKYIQTALSLNQSSSAYDPCIWDILQAILNHIVNDQPYEFDYSSIAINHLSKVPPEDEFNTLDSLLQALNEPNYTSKQCIANKTNDLSTPADSSEQKPISTSLANSFSFLIDLSQFRLSHAALIHLRSQNIIYIRKHVIWFGSSPLNDICLENFNHSHSCQYTTDRHACLYYDRQRNLFELLNYSEYGTIVDDLRYGFGSLMDDDDNKQENENTQKCFCLTKPIYHSTWDGPAQIEQGTVIKIGCHEFLFYRHIVR